MVETCIKSETSSRVAITEATIRLCHEGSVDACTLRAARAPAAPTRALVRARARGQVRGSQLRPQG